jgi:PAS domain S-box-containing protein
MALMNGQTTKHSYSPDFVADTERLHFTLQAAGIGIWEVRLDNNTVSWDDHCRKLFGLDKDNTLPYDEAIKHIHPEDVVGVTTAVQNALNGVDGGKYEMEYRTIGGDDSILRYVRFTGQAFFDENKKPFRFAGIGQDVTRIKNTEHAKNQFEQSDKQFRELPNSLPELVWTTDKNGAQTFASTRWKEFTGVEPVNAETFRAIVHPEDIDNVITLWTNSLENGNTYSAEVRLKKHTDEFQWFSVKADPIKNEKRDIEKWVGSYSNINERKLIEQDLFAAFKELKETEATFNDVTNSSPTGLWLSNETGELTYLNKTLVEWTGLPYESLLGFGWSDVIIEQDRERSVASFSKAVEAKTHYDVNFRIKKGNGDIVWCRAAGDPFYREGVYKGYAGFCMDIDEMINVTSQLRAEEERFRNIFEQAPMAIALLRGRDMVIEVGNDKIFEVWGKGKSITGKKLIAGLPEIEGQGFIELLENVFDTGVPFFGNGFLAKLTRRGKLDDGYFDFVYTPLRDSKKNITGIMVLATEVTEQILAKKKIEESEAKLRSLIQSAPAAIGLFVGRDLIIDMPNQSFIDIVGKGPDIAGRPLKDVMPELASQPFLQILDDVYTSGKTYQTDAAQVHILRNGTMTHNFFNITYSPLLDAKGEVYAILDIAVDVTEAVNAKRKIEEAEDQLKDAIEIAELATWTIDVNNKTFHSSKRFAEWLGLSAERLSLNVFSELLEEESRQELNKLIESTTNSTPSFEHEYKIYNKITHQMRVIHVQGKLLYDNDVARTIKGVAQDITTQQALQKELERLVQKRTEELAAANGELQSANEKLTTTNEELSESTQQLIRSNEELSQYAYVASHDLQEPLRKIRTFADRLVREDMLPEKLQQWIKKIDESSERMSLLIKNLLEFSRLIKPEESFETIKLNDLVEEVVKDFDLILEEKKVKLSIGTLPSINGSALQMHQLFQNLLSNAIKFTLPDRTPAISINSEKISFDQMQQYGYSPKSFDAYDHITVADNGIGFDQRHTDHIFEIFKRLHGRTEYKGSGIGLALCRRIVANHGGYIHAESTVGNGSTFHIFLPKNNSD